MEIEILSWTRRSTRVKERFKSDLRVIQWPSYVSQQKKNIFLHVA